MYKQICIEKSNLISLILRGRGHQERRKSLNISPKICNPTGYKNGNHHNFWYTLQTVSLSVSLIQKRLPPPTQNNFFYQNHLVENIDS